MISLHDLSLITIGKSEVPLHDIMNFCRQLAALNGAGVPLIKAIKQLTQSTSSPIFKNILATVADDIAAGFNLANSLKKHPNAFPPLVSNTIEVGENTGHLNEVLLQLSTYLETTIINRRNLVSAVRYPLFVIGAIVAAMIIVDFFVMPKFAALFAHFHTQLPFPTRILMASSTFMINHWGILAVVVCCAVIGVQQLIKIPEINYFWDKKKLSLPVIGGIQRRILLSQFAWTFSLVLRSGLPIIKGLVLASNSTGNFYFGKQLLVMSGAIQHGETFSQAAVKSNLFTPMVVQMIEVGEESGKLDELIGNIAKYYDDEVSYDMRRLNESIEPILLGIIGSMVLVLALAVYLPMWDLIEVIKK
jgi:MSHA biogenesis protein MshG